MRPSPRCHCAAKVPCGEGWERSAGSGAADHARLLVPAPPHKIPSRRPDSSRSQYCAAQNDIPGDREASLMRAPRSLCRFRGNCGLCEPDLGAAALEVRAVDVMHAGGEVGAYGQGKEGRSGAGIERLVEVAELDLDRDSGLVCEFEGLVVRDFGAARAWDIGVDVEVDDGARGWAGADSGCRQIRVGGPDARVDERVVDYTEVHEFATVLDGEVEACVPG